MLLYAPAVEAAEQQITSVRWGRNVDALTGDVQLRLVLETNAPVFIEKELLSKPNWRLVVTIRDAKPGKLVVPQSPDKATVDKLSIQKSGDNTLVIMDLPSEIGKEQYRVFSLKADPAAKRPFRIVIDIGPALPKAGFQFTPGLKGKFIALDPGHGGTDPGAIGAAGYMEKELNLAVAMRVKSLLEKAGAQVRMTRTTDVDVSNSDASDREELLARTLVANRQRTDIFVSIHHNSSPNPAMQGTSTYYYRKSLFDELLAQTLQTELLKGGRLDNMGVRTANFFVVKNTNVPAALIEVGFISNPQEERICAEPSFQQKIAQSIVNGLDAFFTKASNVKGEN
jgi:N-acetylmuramoyl-L-alanine amidase